MSGSRAEPAQPIEQLVHCACSIPLIAHRIEEDCCLPENMASLDKLLHALAELLIALVHLDKSLFVLGELRVQLVDSLRSPWADRDERKTVIQWTDGNSFFLLLNLCGEETNATGHLVNAANFAHVRALEWVHIGVQLGLYVSTCRRTRAWNAHVFKLDITKLPKLCNRVMCNFSRDNELHQAHRLRAFEERFSTRAPRVAWLYLRNNVGYSSPILPTLCKAISSWTDRRRWC